LRSKGGKTTKGVKKPEGKTYTPKTQTKIRPRIQAVSEEGDEKRKREILQPFDERGKAAFGREE